MANLIMEIGTWGIAHNAQNWILGIFAVIGICFMAWDYKTSPKK